jgi:hypothetical protein
LSPYSHTGEQFPLLFVLISFREKKTLSGNLAH